MVPVRTPDRWQIGASLSGSVYTISYDRYPDIHGNDATGTASLTHFVTPVVDDGAPRSLQPFLQRVSTIDVSIGGSGFVTRNPSGGQDRTNSHFGASAGFDVYVTRSFIVFGSFGYGYDVLHDTGVDQTTHTLHPAGGIAFRVNDLRFDFAYSFSAYDTNGNFDPLRWGTAQATAFMVFDRMVSLTLWGRAVQSGGMGGGGCEVFPTQNLGLYGSVYGGEGELYRDDVQIRRIGGDLGLAYWVLPRLRLEATYDIFRDDIPAHANVNVDGSEIHHTLTASVAARLP